MKPTIEDIFDQALVELRQGKTIDEVVSSYPEFATELQELLQTAALASSIPRNIVPTPMRRHKFAEQLHRSWWLRSVSVLRLGIMPLTLVLLLLGGRTLVIKTQASLPNDNLYSLKRASEQLKLTLTRDTNEQAAFQVQLTQRRLEEVKQAAANQDPAQEAAALTALKDQTQKTFATVPQVAAATAITHKDSSLLDSLVAINKQQQEVLTSIQPQGQSKAIAATALNTAKENSKTMMALVATVQEQTLADLQDKVTLTGEVGINKDKTKLTIDSTSFSINDDTVFNSVDGKTITVADLVAKSKVTIVGSKSGASLSAKIVTVLELPTVEKVEKPAPQTQPARTPTAKPVTPTPTPAPAPTNTPSEPNPNQVTSGIIVEPAAPQYNP